MSEIAVRAEGLSKSYQINRSRSRSGYRTLQEDVISLLKRPFSKSERASTRETFWALKDVSFEVKQGEVLGIIGRNGAGKSTLLKILSRITKPTSGRADIYGRIGSLLEVGTGFHAELTGRENIFLNGAVLGMTRRDIQKQFDEIVTFAEVGQFLDTPVKRYSSGMYMRLAFAVAAHLEPEVLIVDEVLAVGDAEFQQKSLGKMGDVAKSGRTVLFVSHNMAAVQNLCTKGILLERGRIAAAGEISEIVGKYVNSGGTGAQEINLSQRQDRKGEGNLHFTRVQMFDENNMPIERILSGQNVKIRFSYESNYSLVKAQVNIAFNVYNSLGLILTNLNSKDVGMMKMPISSNGYFECVWSKFNLRSGVYNCTLYCEVNNVVEDWIQWAFQLHVEDGNYYGTGSLMNREQGDIFVNYRWHGEEAVPAKLEI